MSVLWMWPRLQQLRLMRQCAMIGSNSLQTFVVSVALSYAAGFLWIEYFSFHAAYIALCLISVVLLGLFAHGYARRAARAKIRSSASG